jgi:DNA polymerase-3 subunit beta
VKLLFNSVSKAAEGDIEVEIDAKERASITAGSAKFKLAGMPESEFPRLPKDEDAFIYTLAQQTLKEMLRKVSYAASQDDTRRTLKGVLMSFKNSKLTMVATDGRRLALVENEIEFPKNSEKDIVLPSKTVSELQRSLNGDGDVSVMLQKSQICFKLGETQIYSKLIEDAYPNYRQVIPAETAEHISVDRQLLLNALDRASVMTMDEAHSTKLIFSSGKLTVTSAVSDIGEAKDEVAIKYAGEKIEIVFNPTYVMDPLKAIDDDEITINLDNGHSPAVIKCSIPFLYVLMPLRIS